MTPRKKSPRTVAGYARLSVTTEESVSIAGQDRLIREACAARGWPEPVFFVDEGVSGSKKVRRPARDDLERRLAAGEFEALVVKSVDRLARSVGDFHRIARLAEERGAALVVVDANLDTSTPAGKMVLGMLATFAEFEADTISARVRDANVGLRKEGRATGGPVPYGFVNVPNPHGRGKVRAVDEDKAATVRRIAADVLAGKSLRRIGSDLSDEGVPAPRGGDLWDSNNVRNVVTNPGVAGMQRDPSGEWIRDEKTGLRRVAPGAILDVETYGKVLATVEARRYRRTSRAAVDRSLLDGIATCAHCGRPMRSAVTRGGRYTSLVCSGAARKACDGGGPAITEAPLVEHVLGVVRDEIGDVEIMETEVSSPTAHVPALTAVREEIADVAASFATATPDRLADLAAVMGRLREEEARILSEADANPGLVVLRSTGRTYGEALSGGDHAEIREILSGVLARVAVRRVGKGRYRGPVADRVQVEFASLTAAQAQAMEAARQPPAAS